MAHPSHALSLLLNDAEHSELLAENLEKLNRKRQKLTEDLMKIADALAEPQKRDPAIIIHHKDFHGGIIGLLAAKLVEKYSRPAIVMEKRGETFIGSCRSIPDINILIRFRPPKIYLLTSVTTLRRSVLIHLKPN